jgi:Ni,Fe-hydrogenase III large subunit
MDRVDDTGVLRKKTAEDLGVTGLVGRASGIAWDLRKIFPRAYADAGFHITKQAKGDALARLKIRIDEVEESCRLIAHVAQKIQDLSGASSVELPAAQGAGIGAVEGWRGPVFYWVDQNLRCK